MADPKLIQEWLQKADEDLGFAASIIEGSPFLRSNLLSFATGSGKVS